MQHKTGPLSIGLSTYLNGQGGEDHSHEGDGWGEHNERKRKADVSRLDESYLEPPSHLLQMCDDDIFKYTENLRKRTKATEQKAGKAKAMGKYNIKLLKLAHSRRSYNKNKAKKAKKQEYMKEYRQKNKEIGVNPELKAKNAANRKASRAYQKFAEKHNKLYSSKKDMVPASLKMKETKIFFEKSTRKYFVAVERLKNLRGDI